MTGCYEIMTCTTTHLRIKWKVGLIVPGIGDFIFGIAWEHEHYGTWT